MLRWFKANEKGFTLVELLVVVAILGILASVALPSLSGLTANAKVQASIAEWKTVQVSIDAMMASKSISTVTPTGPTNDMTSFPAVNVLYPNFMRSVTTHGSYSVANNGAVNQIAYP